MTSKRNPKSNPKHSLKRKPKKGKPKRKPPVERQLDFFEPKPAPEGDQP